MFKSCWYWLTVFSTFECSSVEHHHRQILIFNSCVCVPAHPTFSIYHVSHTRQFASGFYESEPHSQTWTITVHQNTEKQASPERRRHYCWWMLLWYITVKTVPNITFSPQQEWRGCVEGACWLKWNDAWLGFGPVFALLKYGDLKKNKRRSGTEDPYQVEL